MHILFTKKLDKKLIAERLGGLLSYEFIKVIRITHLEVEPFDLKNKSLIFTSVNGVRSFFENKFNPNEDFTKDNFNKIYAVGKKTKSELRKYGFGTFKVTRHASELSDFIISHAPKEKFLHFCGNLALDIFEKKLSLQNIWYKKVPLYRTELLYPDLKNDFQAIAFFSPSGVRSFLKYNSLEDKIIFSIGFTTEKELKKHTKQQIHTSKESNLEDLLNIISATVAPKNK